MADFCRQSNIVITIFPKVDFRGFWICCSAENSTSNDTKLILAPFFSGYCPFFTFKNQTTSDELFYRFIWQLGMFVELGMLYNHVFSHTKETVKLCQNAVIFLFVSPILVDAKMSLASSPMQYIRVLTWHSSDSRDSPDARWYYWK